MLQVEDAHCLLLRLLGEMADPQEWWLTSWLVAQCADILVTTRLAMWY
jgi:hypothetical protein